MTAESMSSVVLLQNNVLLGTGRFRRFLDTHRLPRLAATLTLTPATQAGQFPLPHHIKRSRTSEGIWQRLWGWLGEQNQLWLIHTWCMHLMKNTFRVEWWHNGSFSVWEYRIEPIELDSLSHKVFGRLIVFRVIFQSMLHFYAFPPFKIPSDKYFLNINPEKSRLNFTVYSFSGGSSVTLFYLHCLWSVKSPLRDIIFNKSQYLGPFLFPEHYVSRMAARCSGGRHVNPTLPRPPAHLATFS